MKNITFTGKGACEVRLNPCEVILKWTSEMNIDGLPRVIGGGRLQTGDDQMGLAREWSQMGSGTRRGQDWGQMGGSGA